MANTFQLLSYANTFDNWVVLTNQQARELNSIGKYDWTKDSGILFLNGNPTSLQANNGAIFSGTVQVSGTGSSMYVQNNLTVDRQVYFTNTTLGLTNSGQANINGLLIAQGPGTGLFVANTANVGGRINVSDTGIFNNAIVILNNTGLSVSGTTNANTLFANTIQANNSTRTANLTVTNLSTLNSVNVTGNSIFVGNEQHYTSDLGLNAAAPKQNARFNVNRLPDSNASIQWNESSKWWELRDVNNTNDSTAYSRVLTTNTISDSIVSQSSVNVASSLAANILSNNIISIRGIDATQNLAIAYANTSVNTIFGINNTQNLAIAYANTSVNTIFGINNTQNLAIAYANSTVNTVQILAQAAFNQANVTVGVDATQNTNITFATGVAQGAFNAANAVQGNLNGANASIVVVQGVDNTQNTNITFATGVAQGAFNSANAIQGNLNGANASIVVVQGVDNTQNLAIAYANTTVNNVSLLAQAAFDQANSAAAQANAQNIFANRIYANASIQSNGNMTVAGTLNALSDFNVQGNFVVTGTQVYNISELTLNASSPKQNGKFSVNRQPNTNASIQWTESANSWQIRDVFNTNESTAYATILTANSVSDSITSTSSLTVASSRAANTIQNNIISLQGIDNTQNVRIQAAFNTANSSGNLGGNVFYSSVNANSYFVSSSSSTLGSISGNTVIISSVGNVDSFSNTTFRSAKYYVQANVGSNFHMLEISLIHDGTNVWMTQYGEIFTTISLGTFDASIVSGNVVLSFNPVTTNITVKTIRTAVTI